MIPKRFIIKINSSKKDKWDKGILMLAVQNSLMIPLDIAFKPTFA